MVFALPGEPGLTELAGDFKIHFQDRHGDFYWFVHAFLLSLLSFQNCYDTEVDVRLSSTSH